VSPKLVAGSAVACACVVALAAFLFDLKLERAIVLAPVIVLAVGAAAALVVLWTRVAVESLRRRRHPGRILAAALLAFAVLVVVSLFVGPLPHE
jgi:branched-subunit amino acid ABC-type transport system permease component